MVFVEIFTSLGLCSRDVHSNAWYVKAPCLRKTQRMSAHYRPIVGTVPEVVPHQTRGATLIVSNSCVPPDVATMHNNIVPI